MGEFCVAFWNVENLFDPARGVGRGPRTASEYTAKVDRIASVIRGFFDGRGPDLLGLAEVGDEPVLDDLRGQLGDRYLQLWWGAGARGKSGLGVLGRESVLAELAPVAAQERLELGRPRCVVARCSLHHVREPFLVSVNHWKSDLRADGTPPSSDRDESARWLRGCLDKHLDCTCAIVLGDFNAEPFARCFGPSYLRCERYFKRHMGRGGAGDLYNTAWRFLPAPDYWEAGRQKGYRESRPKTTLETWPPVIYDQLIVSRRALRDGPIELREASVSVHHGHEGHTSHGNLVPRGWVDGGSGGANGASDHFPLLAVFDVDRRRS